MNRNEVKLWMQYHGALFSAWSDWYGRAQSNDSPLVKAERRYKFDAIAKAFVPIEATDAKAASDAMLAGDVQRPYLCEDHVAAIIRHANAAKHSHVPRPMYVNGERVYACHYCDDGGMVCTVWPSDPRGTAATVCCCASGERHAMKLPEVLRFNPQIMQKA